MPRKVSIGVCSFVVLALSAAIAPAAQAANTWEGVWNTDFGRMTLSAGGSGSYEGFSPGTVSGPAVGDVNEGTWHRNAQDPQSNTDNGTYRFVLSAGGQSFSGTWAYDGGGCGSACGWNGTCIEGACLDNGVDDGGGGGGGDGGNCKARSGGSGRLAAADGDKCPRDVKFRFRVNGLPAEPGAKDRPEGLDGLAAEGLGFVNRSSDQAAGSLDILTHFQGPAPVGGLHQIILSIAGPAEYEENRKKKHFKIKFEGVVAATDDPSCNVGEGYAGTFAIKEKEVALRLAFSALGGCLSTEPILWRTKSFQKASIKYLK